MRVYEAIARAFVAERVETVFTLLGTAIVDCAGALDAAGVSLCHVHHEGAGLAMADGYARSGGGVGVCAFTWGPGITNTALQLQQAARAGTPVVVLTAHPVDPAEVHYADHRALAEATGAGHEYARRPAGALAAVRNAFYRARTERRPVLLELPPDALAAPLPAPYDYRPSGADLPEATRVGPDPGAVAAAAATISAAHRPVVIAGRGALWSGAREAIRELADRTGALLATSLPLLGWFHGDPYQIGVAGGYSRPLTRQLFAGCDCVIAVGAGLNPYTTDRGRLFGEAAVVWVDAAPERLLTGGGRAAHYLRGDATVAARALAQAVTPGARYRTGEVRDRIEAQRDRFDEAEFSIEPGRVDPRVVIDELDAALPDPYRIVFGSGHQRDIGAMHLQRWRGMHISSDGAIGQGLSFAIGAALHDPRRPVVAVEGDGGVLMNVQELATAVRYRLPLLLVVMNNAALGSEYYQLPVHGFASELGAMPETDFAAVARGFGCRATTVTRLEQLRSVVDEFLADPAPAVADVRIDRKVVSIRFRARLADAARARQRQTDATDRRAHEGHG